MNLFKNRFLHLASLIISAVFLRFVLKGFLAEEYVTWFRIVDIIFVLGFGAFFVLKEVAEIIEETTEILSERTKIASGLLQSLGTAFPDMVLGIVAAILSLGLVKENYSLAINFAIIAAATTFGSNIYNIAHAAWCVWRQNIANKKESSILMFPGITKLGTVIPMHKHDVKPDIKEIDTSMDILNVLTILTAITAVCMVVFGAVTSPPENMKGDLYQLIRPVGIVIFFLSAFTMYFFRKTKKQRIPGQEFEVEERYYAQKPTWLILLVLALSGVTILFAAESMVVAVENLCNITGMPFVIAGVLAGIIGCMGEMIVVHNFTVNPKGRIGDALVGVAMDNIVTTMGAAIVAIMGGIFLGGNALILIFVIILTLNTTLLWQISRLKNFFLKN